MLKPAISSNFARLLGIKSAIHGIVNDDLVSNVTQRLWFLVFSL